MSRSTSRTNSTKVFVFELASCSNVELSPGIVVEGLGMFSTLMRDFSLVSTPSSFSRPGVIEGLSEYFAPDRWKSRIELVHSEECERGDKNSYDQALELFEEWCERCDRVIAIAPEDEMMLYEFSRIADKHCNLGCSSKVVKVCSDKWKIYNRLKSTVNLPETSLNPLSVERQLVKPRTSCGGCGIGFYDGNDRKARSVIYQEFVEGINLSVSLIVGDSVAVLSVNEQVLKGFEYFGAVVPARISKRVRKEVEDVATEVASRLGLRGYCGVDIVYSDVPYVVDVNARFTTPSVAFLAAYGFNLGKMLLENYEKGSVEIPCAESQRRVCLKKRGDGEKIVWFGGEWIALSYAVNTF